MGADPSAASMKQELAATAIQLPSTQHRIFFHERLTFSVWSTAGWRPWSEVVATIFQY